MGVLNWPLLPWLIHAEELVLAAAATHLMHIHKSTLCLIIPSTVHTREYTIILLGNEPTLPPYDLRTFAWYYGVGSFFGMPCSSISWSLCTIPVCLYYMLMLNVLRRGCECNAVDSTVCGSLAAACGLRCLCASGWLQCARTLSNSGQRVFVLAVNRVPRSGMLLFNIVI